MIRPDSFLTRRAHTIVGTVPCRHFLHFFLTAAFSRFTTCSDFFCIERISTHTYLINVSFQLLLWLLRPQFCTAWTGYTVDCTCIRSPNRLAVSHLVPGPVFGETPSIILIPVAFGIRRQLAATCLGSPAAAVGDTRLYSSASHASYPTDGSFLCFEPCPSLSDFTGQAVLLLFWLDRNYFYGSCRSLTPGAWEWEDENGKKSLAPFHALHSLCSRSFW